MVIGIVVKLRSHEPILHWAEERRAIFEWVIDHADEIEQLSIEAGLNIWTWTPEEGWIQFPQLDYIPGKGPVKRLKQPKRHGNGYDARHPWRFCGDSLIPNPLCVMKPLFT